MRRVEQETHEFKEEYKIRSGIEATNSELKRKHNMGKVWTRGKERMSFAVTMKVTACNIKRFMRQRVNSLPKLQPEAIIVAKDGLLGVATVQISSSFAYLWQNLFKPMPYTYSLAKSIA